jgi:site-specific DNA recombinase
VDEMQKVDGYIRVSGTNGRSGPRFISPDVQRDTIGRLVASKNLELGEVVQELDVSGGKRAQDRELGRLVEKIERGESAGLVVWKVSRFARNLLDGVVTAHRISEAGGRLVAEDFDSAAPMSKALLGLMLGLAEEELDARREGWRQARERAVIENGIPNGRAPVGYRKRPDGRLEVVEREARKVREAFEMRAAGASHTKIDRRFGWANARQLLSNPAYIGVARSGDFVHEHAHPAIVERELWDAVQATRTQTPAATGELTRERLVQGIAVCGGCGRTLKVVHRRRADGSRVPAYYCKDVASVRCPDRAFVRAQELDEYVADFFARSLRSEPRLVDVVAVGQELEQAQSALREAEEQLAGFVELADALRRDDYLRGYRAREERVVEARERVQHLSARLPRIPVGGPLIDLWDGMDVAERREVLAGFLGRVVVTRGASSDLARNVRVEWADGSIADDEQRVGVAAA